MAGKEQEREPTPAEIAAITDSLIVLSRPVPDAVSLAIQTVLDAEDPT